MRIVRSILIVQTVEIVEDRPSRPNSPASTRPPRHVVDVQGEDLPANVIPFTPRQRALQAWTDKPWPLRGAVR